MRIGGLANEVFEVGYLGSGYRLLRDGVERLEALTRAITLGTETANVRVPDHLVVSGEETISFRKTGLL